MVEYVDAFLLATVLSESGTEGSGGGALVDDAADVVVLDPVRPVVLLDAIGADGIPATHQPRHSLRLHSSPMASAAMVQTCLIMCLLTTPSSADRLLLWSALLATSMIDGWLTDVKRLGNADPACRSEFAGFAGVRR